MSDRITGLMIPDGTIVTGEIALVSYLNEEGKDMWAVGIGADMSQSQIIGLLEMAKHAYLTMEPD